MISSINIKAHAPGTRVTTVHSSTSLTGNEVCLSIIQATSTEQPGLILTHGKQTVIVDAPKDALDEYFLIMTTIGMTTIGKGSFAAWTVSPAVVASWSEAARARGFDGEI